VKSLFDGLMANRRQAVHRFDRVAQPIDPEADSHGCIALRQTAAQSALGKF
jgi:hypothetical protein